MQLGMVGLGRMGGNIVRRLMHRGHRCIIFDRNAAAIEKLVKEGATGGADLKGLVAQLAKPRAVWVMLHFSDKLLSAMRHEFGGHIEPKIAG